ncbi:hypothetical protein [Streptomyces sp. NPDC006446]|uniref:hypothetical protein n=1 Tax=Streptomyces sp. NPDC006446 TaxID=3154301 RepID=UPI0033AC3A58
MGDAVDQPTSAAPPAAAAAGKADPHARWIPLGLLLAMLDSNVVGTAMPTVVGDRVLQRSLP